MSDLHTDPTLDEGKRTAATETTAEHGTGGVETYYIPTADRELEKRLLRKFDIHILPALAMMYLFK
jgi:hypothetical protein